MKSDKARAGAAGAGILLATGTSVMVNVLTSNFSWAVAAWLAVVVVAAAALAFWQHLADRAGPGSAPARGRAQITVRQRLGRVPPTGQVTGIVAPVQEPSQYSAYQSADVLEGDMTGFRASGPGRRPDDHG